ncbi:MAG: Rrf2 family transcriptional regulator [Spirochaetia bacterium]|nr:Rrf2 family transcriptional regulator [Spirochaetia bacterium]
MRISTKGRYSLEALLYLAMFQKGEYVSVRDIAEYTGISDGYLEQLFIPLKKAGIIISTRGPHGGYLPGRMLEHISVGDVLRAAEGPLEPVACLESEKCPNESWCLSRNTWGELYRTIADCVNTVSLADLMDAYRTLEGPEYII